MKDKSIGVVLRDLKRGDTLWGRVSQDGRLECDAVQFFIEAQDLVVHKPSANGGLLMPFGKHKGKSLGDVPADYFDWLLGEDWFAEARWTELRLNIEKELEFRSSYPKEEPSELHFSVKDLDPRKEDDDLPF